MENLRRELISSIMIACQEREVDVTEDFISFLVCIFYARNFNIKLT